MKPIRIEGLVAATFTPMKRDGAIDTKPVERIVDHLVNWNIAALYVNGSTGEGISLTSSERRAMAEAYVGAARGRLPAIVQVGALSLREAHALAEHAAAIGADAVSAAPPNYFPIRDLDVLIASLKEVASGAPELPFYYYHIPTLTGLAVDMAEFLERASKRIENFAGIKYTASSFDQMQACIARAGDAFEILSGFDEMLLFGLTAGVKGAVGSTYNFAAPIYTRLIAAFERGDLDAARACQRQAQQMIEVIVRHGLLSAMKSIMKMIGFDCGPPRLPVPKLDSGAEAALEASLRELGLFEWIDAAAR